MSTNSTKTVDTPCDAEVMTAKHDPMIEIPVLADIASVRGGVDGQISMNKPRDFRTEFSDAISLLMTTPRRLSDILVPPAGTCGGAVPH